MLPEITDTEEATGPIQYRPLARNLSFDKARLLLTDQRRERGRA